VTIIDDAITLEERARSYYADAAERVTDPSGKRILDLLAKEEERHAQVLEKMRAGDYEELGSSSLISEVKGLVEGAVKEGKDAISSDHSLHEMLQKAMEIEQATKSFYEEKGSTATDPKEKELFGLLSEQELGHYLLVSGLVEYFDRPAEWIESAEFGLRPEY
jgi:rubrerythrin